MKKVKKHSGALLVALLLTATLSHMQAQTVTIMTGGQLVDQICDEEAEYILQGINPDGEQGSFRLLDASDASEIAGHIDDLDATDNQAVLIQTGLLGDYLLAYEYTTGPDTKGDTLAFSVRMPQIIELASLPDTICPSDDSFQLHTELSNDLPGDSYILSGDGVSGNSDDGFFLNPGHDSPFPGYMVVSLYYTTVEGCSFSRSDSVYRRNLPSVAGISGLPAYSCVGEDAEPIIPTIIFPDPGENYTISGPGVSGSQDNGYYFDPGTAGLEIGWQVLVLYYQASTGCSVSLEDSVLLHPLPTLRGIQDLPDSVCRNDEPYLLLPDVDEPVGTYVFSGLGVSGDMDEGYYFDPTSGSLATGKASIDLSYTSVAGCEVNTTVEVFISFVPELQFSTSPSCIPEDGGIVYFNNQSFGKYSVDVWTWDFGDESSSSNTSDLTSPTHFYSSPGNKEVVLTALTYEGCTSSQEKTISLGSDPEADFTWMSDCYLSGSPTGFLDRTHSPYSKLDTLIWTFQKSSGGIIGQMGSGSPDDTIVIQFSEAGSYHVTLYVENEAGCSGRTTRTLALESVYSLETDVYLEDFNEGPADWKALYSGSGESWITGEPDFNGFEPETDNKAWYTRLPATEGYIEHSWVQSPCLDLRNMEEPMIQLDIMKSFVPGTDGAVLQYRDVVSDGWKPIGRVGEGMNWYNSENISHMPGGSSSGWGLNEFDPDQQWVRTASPADEIAGLPAVRFRIALGSGPASETGNQGFAFDNFFIGKRSRISLVEYFTNTGSSAAVEADKLMADFAALYEGMQVDIHYHTDYPGEDPLNQLNPLPPAARSFVYGVPDVPYAVFNGGTEADSRWDFSDETEQPDGDMVMQAGLEIPPFLCELDVNFMDDGLDGRVDVSCLAREYPGSVQLYVALVEKEVLVNYPAVGDKLFRQVVLDMLPTPTGVLLGSDWQMDEKEKFEFSWNYAPYTEDKEDLQVVTFLFDRDKQHVLQVVTTDFELGTSLSGTTSDPGLRIYPNPADSYTLVNLGAPAQEQGHIRIYDLQGRMISALSLKKGVQIIRIPTAQLAPGMYLIEWEQDGRRISSGRLLK